MYKTRLLLVTILLLAVVPATAQEEEEDNPTIKYRQSYMSAVAGHFGAMYRIAGGARPGESHMKMHATMLARLLDDTALLFPEGSGEGKTDALPVIWEQPEDFADKAAASSAAARQLVQALDGDDEATIKAAMRKVGGTCRDCHETFRKPKD